MDLLCFFSVLCLLCLCARLFICALWSHIESFIFLLVKKTIEQIYRTMYLLICKLIVVAFIKCSICTLL